MLMFLGIVLLIWFITAFLNKGNFKRFLESSKEFENLTKEDFDKDDELAEKAIVFSVKAVGVFLLGIVLMVVQLTFMIGAFSVDFLVLPTLLMLIMYIYKLVRSITSKSYRERDKEKSEREKTSKAQFRRGVSILYILYILALIIFI